MAKKQIRVLIVEDNQPMAYLIGRLFAERSAQVAWDLCLSPDGEEALDCLFQRGVHASAPLPDFVLLDWNLPKVNGEQVLRTHKSNERLCSIPVLVFSCSEQSRDIDAAYKAHANGYIPKPLDLNGLNEIIEGIERFWVHTARLPSKPIKPETIDGVIS